MSEEPKKKFIDRIGKGRQDREVVVNEHEQKFIECLNQVMGTSEGKYVFKRLLNITGFHQTSVTIIEGKVSLEAISFNEGRRSVWIDIRSRMNTESKKRIET